MWSSFSRSLSSRPVYIAAAFFMADVAPAQTVPAGVECKTDCVMVSPRDGIATTRLWGAVDLARKAKLPVLLKPGVYKVDNTIDLSGVAVRGLNTGVNAFADSDDGFAILEMEIKDGPRDQPAVQLDEGGRLEHVCIRWRAEWPREKRGTGIAAAGSAFVINNVKIVGAHDGIAVGRVFRKGDKNTGRFEISRVNILFSRNIGLHIARSMEWSYITDVTVRFCSVGIELMRNDELRFQRVRIQGRHKTEFKDENQYGVLIKKGGELGKPEDGFCAANFKDLECDAFVHLMRIEGDGAPGRSHVIRIDGGNSLTHYAAVQYLAAACELRVHNVRWKGNKQAAVAIQPDTRDVDISVGPECNIRFPGGERQKGL